MRIVIGNKNNQFLETISFENLDNINETLKNFSSIKGPLKAKIFAINESISSHQLLKFKNNFDNINICSFCIYSNNRDTIVCGKFLKIYSVFIREQEIKNKLLLFNSKKKDDILHKGTVRSGERISSNGNLCIIGDVNPGAIVSAKKKYLRLGQITRDRIRREKWK